MSNARPYFWISAVVLTRLCLGADVQVSAQTIDKSLIHVVPLDMSDFRDIIDSNPENVPVLVRHRQDPNALRPNESLSTGRRAPSEGEQRALGLLGQPRSNQSIAGRGRLRMVAQSQNRAAPMIGDLFGSDSTSLTITRDLMDVIPYVSPPSGGAAFNGFVGFTPNGDVAIPAGPFYAGATDANGFPRLTTIGLDTNGDNLQDTFPGLLQYSFNPTTGTADPAKVQDPGPFDAVLTGGKTVKTPNGDTVFVLGLKQTLNIENVPNPAQGGVVGRVKIAENTSPMPRDRVYFNYSYFSNVPLVRNGVNINRFTPGFEKTILDGNASFEIRTPFATTLGSNISSTGITDGTELEFGNVSLALKSLIYSDDELAISGGAQIGLPSADPVNVNLADGTTIVRIKNQTVNLMPFLGALYTPNERFFTQSFLQFDFAANGNDVLANLDNTRLRRIGSLQDSSYVYLDWSAGYWTYLADDPSAFLTGVAPTFELHMNQSLQASDSLRIPGSVQLGRPEQNVSVLNAVLGTTFQFGPSSSLTMAYATPLTGGSDRQFDGEFRLFFNRRFGPQTVQSRAF